MSEDSLQKSASVRVSVYRASDGEESFSRPEELEKFELQMNCRLSQGVGDPKCEASDLFANFRCRKQ
eukprot:2787063-Karenia_brevis.AAC.1